MSADAASGLEQARDAYARRAWSDALDLLQRADRQAKLGIDDLERLMWSAGMLDRDAELLATCERLFNSCLELGNSDRAAYWAFFYAFRLFALNEAGRATAWMQRSQRLVDSLGHECAATGYLLVLSTYRHLAEGDNVTAGNAAASAQAIGERCGEHDLVALAKCLHGRALVRQGEVAQGVALLDDAMLTAVGATLSPIVTGLIYCNVISTCRQIYAFDRSREWTDALAQWCGTQPQLVQFNGLCQLHRAEILEMNGAWQDAVTEARRATRSLARAIAAETEAGAAYQEAEIHRLRGELTEAEDRYRVASRLGLEPQPGMALLRLAQGRGDDAVATLRRVLAVTVHPLGRARLLPAYVEILIAMQAPAEAREACCELEAIAGRFATDILSAIARQARGEVELSDGDPAVALTQLRVAIATWRRANAPYLEARLRVRPGQACRALRDEDGATLEFEAARAAFLQLGAVPDLARVESLLRPARQGARDKLTPREPEVLALIATGCTNKRIATELGLSEKTVDRHVSNIFDKLDVSSRAAATAFAFRHRLL